MGAARVVFRGVVVLIVAMLMLPAGIMAQDEGDSGQAYRFSKEELTQMLAPIALYPDALTAQILMASTYPLELVEADRWMRANPQLKGNDLDTALQDKPWDPSVKSLCHFPDVLASMSDKLDQTRKLGDAFLGQEDEVMATIQELRRRAQEQGNLRTTEQQKVVVEREIVTIEPTQPDVIYVPVYDPYYVYGPWWYPAFPPYYWYYPPGYLFGVSIGFTPGFFFGFDAFTWAWCDWRFHRIHIDIGRTRHFNRHYDRRDIGPVWRHNPVHRKGVAYRDLRTSQRFGARPPRGATVSPERRGYPSRVELPGQRTPQLAPRRTDQRVAPQVQQRTERSTVSQPRQRVDRQAVPQARQQPSATQRPVVRDTPFRGVGEGSFERRAAERGGTSRRSFETQPQGGGFRGGQIQRPSGGSSFGGQTQRQPSGGSTGTPQRRQFK